ncbi:MAG: hypothetical protein VB142_11715 [Burkholderia sp.]
MLQGVEADCHALGAREDALMPLRGCGIPTGLVDRHVESFDADLVNLDNAGAVYAGLAHLFEQGSSRCLREAAFRAVLAELGRDREAAPTAWSPTWPMVRRWPSR